MIPKGRLLGEETMQYVKQPSRTYRLRRDKDRVQGYVDGLNAIEQAIYKILSTERYEHLIYGFNYGMEWRGLIGKDPIYIKAKVKRRIEEALLQDDRILKIEEFKASLGEDTDELVISFTAVTDRGGIDIHKEVNLNE